MKLKETGEFGLIELIKRKFPAKDKHLVLGIGDDAAVIKTTPKPHPNAQPKIVVDLSNLDERPDSSMHHLPVILQSLFGMVFPIDVLGRSTSACLNIIPDYPHPKSHSSDITDNDSSPVLTRA